MKNKLYTIRSRNCRAFTLPEVLVSVGILAMVIMATTSLVVAAIRTNKDNSNTIIAYGLAQEGIEAIRNIRDSNWLLNAKFTGEVGGEHVLIWGEKFSDNADKESYFTVEYNPASQTLISETAVNDPMELQNYVPWKLRDITEECIDKYGECSETLLSKIVDNNQLVQYMHTKPIVDQQTTVSTFHRYIEIKAVPYSSGNLNELVPSSKFLKMKVESVVEWKEFNRDRKVVLDTELTDWKPLS